MNRREFVCRAAIGFSMWRDSVYPQQVALDPATCWDSGEALWAARPAWMKDEEAEAATKAMGGFIPLPPDFQSHRQPLFPYGNPNVSNPGC